MSDNPRSSGHPSDIPSSRYKDSNSGSSDTHGPGNNPPVPPVSTGSSSGGGHQTRNIIIGAIATIFASTSVYYLTQYVNNKKSSDSPPDHLVMKEATISAWKRYVIMDNIYYKAVKMMIADKEKFGSNDQKFTQEIMNESNSFKKEAGKITDEKNIDPALKTMLSRRIERQTEFEEALTLMYNKLKTINAQRIDSLSKEKLAVPVMEYFYSTTQRLYKKAATEIEDLTKTLTESYGTPFNASEVLSYTAFKEGAAIRKTD